MAKKKKEFRFFWEKPIEELGDISSNFKLEPFEFKFTIPNFPVMPEIKLAKSIPVNISTTDKDVVVQAELPGFKKDEINLNVTESFIEISAHKKQEKTEKTEKHFRQEMSTGSVKRAFTLPDKVDPDNAKAKLENGLLTIILPKLSIGKKKRKKVEII
jgi:HSP20 family protein